VFKYVAHQELIQDVHKEVFAAKSGSKNPFAEFHNWRNEILGLSPAIIDQRIKEYCEKNSIALTKKILAKSKHEKLLLLDSYEAVRNATWDFLQIKGEVNALTLANLVGDIIRTEKGEILRSNEDNLFQTKQDLGQFSNFQQDVNKMREVRSAREILAIREATKKQPLSTHNQALKKALNYKPKENKE
jgi:Xaa-Pro aminopeptidase